MAKRARRRGNSQRGNGRPGPLTPRGTTGRRSHGEAVEQARAAKRRQLAFEYYAHQRMSMRQVAEVLTAQHGLACTAKTVCLDIQREVRGLRDQASRDAADLVAIEVARTEHADRAMMPMLYASKGKGKAAVPDVLARTRAHERLLASVERRARLQGLGGEAAKGYSVEQMQAAMQVWQDTMFAAMRAVAALAEQLAASRERNIAERVMAEFVDRWAAGMERAALPAAGGTTGG